jgi:hypothetical protein
VDYKFPRVSSAKVSTTGSISLLVDYKSPRVSSAKVSTTGSISLLVDYKFPWVSSPRFLSTSRDIDPVVETLADDTLGN